MATPGRIGANVRGKGEGAIYKDSRGLWTAVVELPQTEGLRRRKVIRSKDKGTVIRKLSAMKSQLVAHGDLPTAGQTVGQWLNYWLDDLAPKEVRPKTLGGYRSVIRNHVIPIIGKVSLERLTPAHIRRVHDSMLTVGLSSTYALNAHRVLSASLTAAEREGRIARNPATLTAAPRRSTVRQEAFDLDEAIRTLEYVLTIPVVGIAFAVGLLTGARRGEVLGIEFDRVTGTLDLSWQLQRLKLTGVDGKPDVPADFEYRHLTGGLYLTRPKSSAGLRIIPLVDPLKSIIELYIASAPANPYGLLFAIDGEPIDPDRYTKMWRSALAAMGIDKDVVLHGLRHTAIDLLYLAGVPEDIIMEIVGQSTLSVTRSYKSRGAVNSQRLTDAMEKFSALFSQPGGARSGTPEIASS